MSKHLINCTPDQPCGNCASRELGRRLGSGTTGGIVQKYEKKIDDFFTTNWGLRGLSRMTSAESAEDARGNPFD